MKDRKDRVDDALNATRAAVEEGIVPGGGVALLRAKKAVEALKSDNPDIQAGINIVSKALESPIRQIAENAGVEGPIVVGKVLEKPGQLQLRQRIVMSTLWRRASSARGGAHSPSGCRLAPPEPAQDGMKDNTCNRLNCSGHKPPIDLDDFRRIDRP